MRKQSLALRKGGMTRVYVDEAHSIFAISKILDNENILIVINAGAETQKVDVPVKTLSWVGGQEVQNLLSHESYFVQDGFLELLLPSFCGAMIA